MIKMPAIVIEKPKIGRPMWNALKHHIQRERQRKKQEQEADAEVERQRREREDMQKEQEMTLEETKEQVAQSEQRLSQLKEDKHQLFLQLKKVLNEDDTRRKIKESNFNSDMMLLHGYQHQGASLGVPTSHSSTSYLQNLGPSRPLYKSGKDDAMISVSGGPPMPSLYGQSISLIPSLNYQGQSNASKRSRSPSPPPQLYHAFKPHNLSSYNSKSVGNPYGGSPAVPGSIFYTHSVSVSAAHSAANSYQLPPGAMYSYPPGPSSSSRPSFSIPNSMGSKEDAPPPPKHHAGIFVGQGGSSVQQISQRSQVPRSAVPPMTQGYHHQSMEHLMNKSSNNYGPSEQEKFFISSHGVNPSGSNNSGGPPSSTASGLRPHGGLVAPIPIPGASHPSGIPIHQPNHGKSGSITSGHPIQHPQRPPPSTVSHSQSPRLVYTQSSAGQPQPQHPSSRYYGNPS